VNTLTAIHRPAELLASVLGDPWVANHVAGKFSCAEADDIARALVLLGQPDAAYTFIDGHATGDDDSDDSHQWPDDADSLNRATEYVMTSFADDYPDEP